MNYGGKLSIATAISILANNLLLAPSASATTYQVNTFFELQTSISAANAGDIIEFSKDVIATSQVTISRAITIDGKGFTLSVATPGVNESGLNNASASTNSIFSVTTSTKAVVKNMTLLGGNNSTGAIGVTGKLELNNVKIERSRNSGSGGGAIRNSGTLEVTDSYLRRNSALFGGGVYNSGTLIMSNSSLVENRTESANGGGGGVENVGTMWLNNSTFAHNMTTAGGGAVNNYGGTLYVSHSTFVGNVSTGPYDGGAILTFSGGSAKIASSLFAFNYSKKSNNTFVLDDFQNPNATTPLSIPSAFTISNSLVHTAESWSVSFVDSYVTDYVASDTGTNDTLFSGGTFSYPTNGFGAEVTTYGKVFRPNLLLQNGKPTAALISPNSTPGLAAAPVAFEPTTKFGVNANGSTWTSYVGTATTQTVTTDQLGAARSSSTPRVGSLEGGVAQTFLVSSPIVSGGSVSGASVFGDVYNSNDVAVVTAVPAGGKTFTSWSVSINSGAPSTITDNPVSLPVSGNITITPSFVNASAGSRTVTYTATGSNSGLPPSAITSSGDVTISSTPGTMRKSNFYVSSWNSEPNGTGTPYALGAIYPTSSAANLTLYPVWLAQTIFNITYDGNSADSGTVPATTTGSGAVAIPGNPNSLVKSGFRFVGWNSLNNGNGILYEAGDSYNLVSDVTLFAKWAAVEPATQPVVVASPTASASPGASPLASPTPSSNTLSTSSTKSSKPIIKTGSVSGEPGVVTDQTEVPAIEPTPTPTPSSNPTDTIELIQSQENTPSSSSSLSFLVLLGLILVLLFLLLIRRKSK